MPGAFPVAQPNFQNSEGKSITFHGLVHPRLTLGLLILSSVAGLGGAYRGDRPGTVSPMTLHRPHRCQYSERN